MYNASEVTILLLDPEQSFQDYEKGTKETLAP